MLSAFYYLRVVVLMFMEDPNADETLVSDSRQATVFTADSHSAVIVVVAAATVVLGVLGGGLITWAQAAASSSLL